MTVTDIDTARIAPYVMRAIESFLGDPPDTDFQRGYLAALLTVYREALMRGDGDARIEAAERVLRQAC